MKLNPQLRAVFDQYQISPSMGIMCLLSIYHGIKLNPQMEALLDATMQQINISKIVEKDYKTHSIKWNIPLYEGDNTEWAWIESEYRPLFKAISAVKGGSLSSCIKKMQEFFAKHPDVRKSDVLEAARMYIGSVDNPQYLQQADYFIFKNPDTKSSYTSRLEQYIELVKESRKSQENNHRMMR